MPALLKNVFRGSVYFIVLCSGILFAGEKKIPAVKLPAEELGLPKSTLLNINNVSMWANSNGMMERRTLEGAPGVTFPAGTATVVYTGGLLWGGRVRDGSSPALRVGGQTFVSGTVPGRIISPGVAENPSNADVRIYRIRKDWATADLRRDASEIYQIPGSLVSPGQISSVREQYKKDWLEWPWQKGAPYYERNGLPGYQPVAGATADSITDEPGLGDADQVLWFVVNDLNTVATEELYGSIPIGIEEQVTCWAYTRSDLQNVVYQRYRLIYKGTATTPPGSEIEQMYITKWADPDIGTYNDDFAGSDTVLSMGYVYNGNPDDDEFQKLGLTPPAFGYDLLQGPRVPAPGGTAHWDLKTIPDYENLPMTSFIYFTEESRIADYLLGDNTGTRQWFNMMRGFQPQPLTSPVCFIDPTLNECTNFELSGDPITFRGFVDGRQDEMGDRRIAFSSGPFTMALGDTQEVVLALVGGTGEDNRDAVTRMKSSDAFAQDMFNVDFGIPREVPVPDVRISELDQKIIFDWESNNEQLEIIENYESKGFRFETYSFFQLPLRDSPREDWIPFPAYDITKPRFIEVTLDRVRNKPLVNGQTYYFVMQATVYNPDPTYVESRMYSKPIVHEIVPHSPNPGTIYPYEIDEEVSTGINIVGNNQAAVRFSYYNPVKPDGHTYKILYHRSPNQIIDLDEKPTWSLIDSTTADTLLHRVRIDTVPLRIISRGFTIEVRSPRFGMSGVVEMQPGAPGTLPKRESVFNRPNSGENYMVLAGGTSMIDTLTGGNPNDTDVELHFFGDSSWALFAGSTVQTSRWVRVPYTAWQVGKVGRDSIHRQIYTVIVGHGGDSVWRPSVLLDREYNGKTLKEFYPVIVVNDSIRIDTSAVGGIYYDNIPTHPTEAVRVRGFLWVNTRTNSSKVAVWKAYLADVDEDGIPARQGAIIRFERWKAVRNGDEKIFTTTPVIENNLAAAQAEIKKINVFPNPYYGLNRAEVNRFNRFVTFNHLPRVATIRILNIAGELIRVIRKDDPSQFARWDLNNHDGLPAAGGIYIAHIEMNDGLGNNLGTAALKLMIVPEKQFLQGVQR